MQKLNPLLFILKLNVSWASSSTPLNLTCVSLTVTSSTVSFNVTLIYGDNGNCSLGGVYRDVLDIKVGTITVEYYTAGSS